MSPEKSLTLSLRNAYELFGISFPTVVEAMVGHVDPDVCTARIDRWSKSVLRNMQLDITIVGRDNVEPGKAYLYMSNHQSHVDVPVLFQVLGPATRMVGKIELFRIPVFGRAIKEAGFIAIDRGNRERALESLAEAKRRLAAGTSVWIAPEGTRSQTGKLLPFKKGGFVMALEMGWPILPVTIEGTRDALPAHELRTRKGAKVKVTFHPPIDSAAYVAMDKSDAEKRDLLMHDVRTAIASVLGQNA